MAQPGGKIAVYETIDDVRRIVAGDDTPASTGVPELQGARK